MTDRDFAGRYGPWAVVAGASDGVGEAFTHALAERGLNVVMLARRAERLDAVATAVQDRWRVETRTAAVDLSAPDAVDHVAAATDGLDVGFLLYCAGADPDYQPFLDVPLDNALAMVQRNCVSPLRLCRAFAGPMRERRRGGIVLLSSAAVLAGGVNRVTYSATKAFDMVLAEGLWSELVDDGVDVLSLVLSITDTPALRALLAKRGNLASATDGTPIPGAATPEQVVAEGLANLNNGPVWFVGEEVREGAKALGAMGRSEAARIMKQMGAGVMDTKLS